MFPRFNFSLSVFATADILLRVYALSGDSSNNLSRAKGKVQVGAFEQFLNLFLEC